MLEIRATAVFSTWLSRLRNETAKASIVARIRRLAHDNAGDVAPIGSGLSELRIHHGPGYRVYFLRQGSSLIVLLCGGDKAGQKRDIARAKALAKEWTVT